MTVGAADEGIVAAARALVDGLVAEPWGQVSPSVYETGRLVVFAPWLTGHDRRIDYLVRTQRDDGGWGAPGGYALVPTLSATDAALTVLLAENGQAQARPATNGLVARLGATGRAALARTADRGLRTLHRLLSEVNSTALPDMPAADLIGASLIGSIGRHLDALLRSPVAGLDRWAGVLLPVPDGMDGGRLARLGEMLAAGMTPPTKLLHALDVLGGAVRGARTIRPTALGSVGASPAATAAWLGAGAPPGDGGSPRAFLEAAAARDDGPVPCTLPITTFERAWVVSGLARAGVPLTVPADVVASLGEARRPEGVAAGDGLPTDADTTSVALYALGLLGVPYSPDSLWPYKVDGHFSTWPGEDGLSVTVNAHVLEAFGHYLHDRPGADPRYAATVRELTALLLDHQRDDGSWTDRWHASPYYATACCALALDGYGDADGRPAVDAAVDRAVRWVLATQRPDGSWGRWEGTAEETAYALQILLSSRPADPGGRVESAAARGRAHLLATAPDDAPALWHDKDLYRPTAIVRAAVLAALQMARHALGPLTKNA